ncbi:MAG: hypothetical protein L3J82_05785 [Planctomycetes bacterium]|nr:hypothetical protein [Planctomycetota bacterium]
MVMKKLLLMIVSAAVFVLPACGNADVQKNDTSAKADNVPTANSYSEEKPDKPIVEKAKPITVWLQVDGMTKVQGIT